MEIYNEEINDLLAPDNRKLQIHENLEVGTHISSWKVKHVGVHVSLQLMLRGLVASAEGHLRCRLKGGDCGQQ